MIVALHDDDDSKADSSARQLIQIVSLFTTIPLVDTFPDTLSICTSFSFCPA